MALKAMYNQALYPETCKQIQEFDTQTEREIQKVKRFIQGAKLKREYEDYKRFKIDP